MFTLVGFVNVIFLYNTFRVLGPAFDTRLSISTGKDTESFYSPVKVSQTTLSIICDPQTPGQFSPSEMDEKMTYNFSTGYSVQSNTHQSTPSASTGISDRPLLSGHRYTTSGDNPTSLLTARRAISPYDVLRRQLIATPEPAWRYRDLRVDNNPHAGQAWANTRGPAQAPRYDRSPLERRPAIESMSSPRKATSSTDAPTRSLLYLDLTGRPSRHRRPDVDQISFGLSGTTTTMATSSGGAEAGYKHGPPPFAVMRSHQAPEYIFGYPNSAASSRSYDCLRFQESKSQDQSYIYSSRMVTRVVPARPPLVMVFNANAMVRNRPSF